MATTSPVGAVVVDASSRRLVTVSSLFSILAPGLVVVVAGGGCCWWWLCQITDDVIPPLHRHLKLCLHNNPGIVLDREDAIITRAR